MLVYEVLVTCAADFDSVFFHRFYQTEEKARECGAIALADAMGRDPEYAYSYDLTVTKIKVY